MAALTPTDVDRLKAKLDAGDRAGFYLLYHELTGSNEALTQAEIASFSGQLGELAINSNAAARAWLSMTGRGNQYPGTAENFSQTIAEDLYDHIARHVKNGGSGVIRDEDIYDLAKSQWGKYGIGDCFPGNVFEQRFFAPSCSLIAVGVGSLATRPLFETVEPMILAVPPGGRQVTTPDGQATYIIDGSGMVVPGSVLRTQAAPRPFDFNGTRPDDHGQINAPDWAGQAAQVAPNNGSSGSYLWPGITAGGMPSIPALAPPPPPAPSGLFDWLQADLPDKVGGLAPGGGFGSPPSTVGLGGSASFFSPQGFDFGGTQAWPSARSLDGSNTLDIYNGTVPPLPYPPSGPFGGGLMPTGALGPPQRYPLEGGAPSAPLPQTPMTPSQVPASATSPFSVPVPPALLPLVKHFFPEWLDSNKAPAWPSAGAWDDAGTQPNPDGSAGAGLGLAPAQPAPQPFPATPSSPFGVPVPPALLPLVSHFFPQWLDTNNAQASPSGGAADDVGTQPNFAGSAGAGLGLASAQATPQPFSATPSSPFSVPVPPALLPLVKHFFPEWLDSNNAPAWPSAGTSVDAGTQPNPVGSAGAGLGLTAAQPTPQPFPAPPAFDVPIPEALQPLLRLFSP